MKTFFDPPKESADPSIQALKQYGVALKVLTGDNEGPMQSWPTPQSARRFLSRGRFSRQRRPFTW
jgi:hypothetical protein